MKIRWSPEAADDLQRICERIEIDNPEAASRVAGAMYEGCDRLKEFPRVGLTSRRMPGWRELALLLPYIVVYLVTEEVVEITRTMGAGLAVSLRATSAPQKIPNNKTQQA